MPTIFDNPILRMLMSQIGGQGSAVGAMPSVSGMGDVQRYGQLGPQDNLLADLIDINRNPEKYLGGLALSLTGPTGGGRNLTVIRNAEDAKGLVDQTTKNYLDKMGQRLLQATEHADVGPSNPYYDSAEGVRISRDRVLRELKRHSFDWNDLQDWEKIEINKMFGPDGKMNAQDLLDWLGY